MTAASTAATGVEAPESERRGLGRHFRTLWASSAMSNLGDGILLVGAPLLAVTLTSSAFLVSIVSAAVWLPSLLLGLHVGALADRHDRRRIILAANLGRAAAIGAVAAWVAIGELTLPLLYVIVFLSAAASVFADTSAQSILPMLVDSRRLGAANGRLIATQTIAENFMGGPLVGVMVGIATWPVFGSAAACFAGAAAVLVALNGAYRPSSRPPTSLRRDIAEGIGYLRRSSLLSGIATTAALINLGASAFLAVFVLWVAGPGSKVGLTPVAYGLLVGVLGVGSVVGALLVERVAQSVGRAQTLTGSLLVLCLLIPLPALLPEPVAIYAVAFGLGAFSSSANVLSVSIRQRLVPEHLLGRVNATVRLMAMCGMPLGALGGGALGEVAGLPAVFYAAGAICLVAIVVAVRRVSPAALSKAEAAVVPSAALGGASE